MLHFDLSNAVGIAGGITGCALAWRSAKVGDLRAEIARGKQQAKDDLDKFKADAKASFATLREQVSEATTRCSVLEINLDEERKKVGLYYGQNLELKEANRVLLIESNNKGNQIIGLQNELLDIQKNTLRSL